MIVLFFFFFFFFFVFFFLFFPFLFFFFFFLSFFCCISYRGHVFTKDETGGAEPFTFIRNNGVQHAISKYKLDISEGSPAYNALLATWGHLIPWADTARVLQLLHTRYQVAALSNGDFYTLSNATSVFLPAVKMAYIFNSDFPIVGSCFRPCAKRNPNNKRRRTGKKKRREKRKRIRESRKLNKKERTTKEKIIMTMKVGKERRRCVGIVIL